MYYNLKYENSFTQPENIVNLASEEESMRETHFRGIGSIDLNTYSHFETYERPTYLSRIDPGLFFAHRSEFDACNYSLQHYYDNVPDNVPDQTEKPKKRIISTLFAHRPQF